MIFPFCSCLSVCLSEVDVMFEPKKKSCDRGMTSQPRAQHTNVQSHVGNHFAIQAFISRQSSFLETVFTWLLPKITKGRLVEHMA